jgi:hypothetical protein
MSPADRVLPLLSGVRRSGRGWIARCPAHEDRSPSLSVREGDDGRLLLHCWAGCDAASIVGALGLDIRDLFPDRPNAPGGGHARERKPWTAGELVLLAAYEAEHAATLITLLRADLKAGRELDTAALARLFESADRLRRMNQAATT